MRQPSRLRRILKRIGLGLLMALALAFAYVFLLLGEPDEEAKLAEPVVEEAITLPMSALDMPGEANVQSLADSFGQPVLSLYGGLQMQKARIYDTAFGGGYARRVTLTYAFEDGALLTVDSLRPTAGGHAAWRSGYRLDASSLYALAGLDAAAWTATRRPCIFAQKRYGGIRRYLPRAARRRAQRAAAPNHANRPLRRIIQKERTFPMHTPTQRAMKTSVLIRRFLPYFRKYLPILAFDLVCAALTIPCATWCCR